MKNKVKENLVRQQPVIGIVSDYGQPLISEELALLGFDYVIIDRQHGVWNDDRVLAAIRGILHGKAAPIIRVENNSYAAIGTALDSGAFGVILPMVEDTEDAIRAVNAAYYPPKGSRSIGPFGTRMFGENYMKKSNDEILLFVQIETKEGLNNADEILAVDGITGCWIGPADLAASLGIDAESPNGRSRLETAILHVLGICVKRNKIPGIFGNAAHWFKKGFLFLTIGVESRYLLEGVIEDLAVMQRLFLEPPSQRPCILPQKNAADK